MKEIDSDILIVVDIQPEYHASCGNITADVIEKINQTEKPIFFFYVGKRVLGLDSQEDVMGYLLEHGIDENKLGQIRFIEKAYGFFRAWMDEGVSPEIIEKALFLMERENIRNSREFEHQHWVEIAGEDYWDNYALHDHCIYWPEFDDRAFKHTDNFELIGGGRDECLLEIDYYLRAKGKKVTINEQLCYGDSPLDYLSNSKALDKMKRIK